jgi:hypothetical protein
MDRFDAVETLIAAVDGGSLSAASRALAMPLSYFAMARLKLSLSGEPA